MEPRWGGAEERGCFPHPRMDPALQRCCCPDFSLLWSWGGQEGAADARGDPTPTGLSASFAASSLVFTGGLVRMIAHLGKHQGFLGKHQGCLGNRVFFWGGNIKALWEKIRDFRGNISVFWEKNMGFSGKYQCFLGKHMRFWGKHQGFFFKNSIWEAVQSH